MLTIRYNNAVPSDVSPSYYFLSHLSSTSTYLANNQHANINFKFISHVKLMNTKQSNERKKAVNNEMSCAYNVISSFA